MVSITKLSPQAQHSFKDIISLTEEYQSFRLTEQPARLVSGMVSSEELDQQKAQFLFGTFADNLYFSHEEDSQKAYDMGWTSFVTALEYWLVLASRPSGGGNSREARKTHLENVAIENQTKKWLAQAQQQLAEFGTANNTI